MKIVGVIQARTGSTRLPAKVLLPLVGRPALERMIERVAAATTLDDLVVATTKREQDDPIRALAARLGVRCTSGDTYDLIDRHLQVARETGADAVVKLPSDCPLIDPRVIDQVVATYRAHGGAYVFVSNLHPPTWPDGNDVEVIERATLETAWREADKAFQREHTTPFVWDQPERFPALNVAWDKGLDLSLTHRLTLDYAEDYRLLATIFDALHTAGAAPFSVEDIVDYLDANPEVRVVNAAHAGRSWMTSHIGDLATMWQPATQTTLPGGARPGVDERP